MGTTTLSVKEDTHERFNKSKETPEGRAEMSADAFINHLLDLYDKEGPATPVYEAGNPEPVEFFYGEAIESLADIDQIDKIESAVETIENRTGNIERKLEGLQ